MHPAYVYPAYVYLGESVHLPPHKERQSWPPVDDDVRGRLRFWFFFVGDIGRRRAIVCVQASLSCRMGGWKW